MGQDFPTIPDEFALLLHKPSGLRYLSTSAGGTLATAELGELALRQRISLTHAGNGPRTLIELIDATPSGLPWLDAVLTDLDQRTAGRTSTADLTRWLTARTTALRTLRIHRAELIAHGLLRREPTRLLGIIPEQRHCPEPRTRGEILTDMRGALDHHDAPDNRIALLCALVRRAGIGHALGFDAAQLNRLNSIAGAHDLGEGVDPVVRTTMLSVIAPPIMIGNEP